MAKESMIESFCEHVLRAVKEGIRDKDLSFMEENWSLDNHLDWKLNEIAVWLVEKFEKEDQ
jgi:hypothetical protein